MKWVTPPVPPIAPANGIIKNPACEGGPLGPLAGPLSFTKQLYEAVCTIKAFGGTFPLNNVVDVAAATVVLPSIDVLGTAVAAGAV